MFAESCVSLIGIKKNNAFLHTSVTVWYVCQLAIAWDFVQFSLKPLYFMKFFCSFETFNTHIYYMHLRFRNFKKNFCRKNYCRIGRSTSFNFSNFKEKTLMKQSWFNSSLKYFYDYIILTQIPCYFAKKAKFETIMSNNIFSPASYLCNRNTALLAKSPTTFLVYRRCQILDFEDLQILATCNYSEWAAILHWHKLQYRKGGKYNRILYCR